MNILNSEIASLLEVPLQTSKVKLKSYSGTKIEVVGKVTVPCTVNNNKTHVVDFEVVKFEAPYIIGLLFIEKFKLLSRLSPSSSFSVLISRYAYLLEGIGEMKDK